MTKDQATPRPWDYNVIVKWRRIPEELCEANAKLIVHCVNTHDELVDSCNKALAVLKFIQDKTEEEKDAVGALLIALSNAERME